MIGFFSPESPTPFIAQLSLSVPPEVKKISSGEAPIHSAIISRDSFIAFLGILEKAYGCDGFPYSSRRNGFIASKASISSFVVAALSAYTIFFIDTST